MNKLNIKTFNILDYMSMFYSKITKQDKIAFLSTVVIGFLAHSFMYTNLILGHDASNLYWPGMEGLGGSKFILKYVADFFWNFNLPWISGIFTIFFFALSSVFLCRILSLKHPVLIVLFCGLIVTSPTATSFNTYLSSAQIYTIALFFACVAAYFYVKNGVLNWVVATVFVVISNGIYAGFVPFTAIVIILYSLIAILKQENAVKVFIKELLAAFGIAVGYIASYAIILVGTTFANQPLQARVADAGAYSISNYIYHIINAYRTAFYSIIYGTTYMESYSGPPYNYIFRGCLILVTIVIISVLVQKKMIKKPVILLVLAVNAAITPLAMNMTHVLMGHTHMLLMFAFIAPYIFVVVMAQFILEDKQTSKNLLRIKELTVTYTVVVSIMFIYLGGMIANVTYLKLYNNYEAGVHLAGRWIDRIESIEGYTHETEVFIIGRHEYNYGQPREKYDVLKGMNWSYDTALVHDYAIDAFINQLLKNEMNLKLTQDLSYLYRMADEFGTVEIVDGVETNSIIEQYLKTPHFPYDDCYFWIEDTLVFKVGPDISEIESES